MFCGPKLTRFGLIEVSVTADAKVVLELWKFCSVLKIAVELGGSVV